MLTQTVKKILLFASIPACVLMVNSCNSADTSCDKQTLSLQEQIRIKDQRIAGLEDSLQKELNKNAATAPGASATDANAASAATEQTLYKKDGKRPALPEKLAKKYPGEFPEGSAKILDKRNVEFLSEWGLKVMLNEIYARHGMTFGDNTLQAHFNKTTWYKSSGKDNVDEKLSNVEKQNVRYLKNYKFTPQIPV